MAGSTNSFKMFSGCLAATSSISTPPSDDAITTTRPAPRSTTMPKYSSRAMSTPCSISRRFTIFPPGPVWCVTRFMPRIFCAVSRAPAGVNLRLHHHHLAAGVGDDLLRGRLGRVDAEAGDPLRDRHVEPVQQFLGLILVDLHRAYSFFDASISSRTAPADLSSIDFSSAVRLMVMTFSTPLAPRTTGTPMYRSL